jgi:cobalt/nickel transport system permease protein
MVAGAPENNAPARMTRHIVLSPASRKTTTGGIGHVDPRFRIVCTIVFAVFVVSATSWQAACATILAAAVMVALSSLEWAKTLKRVLAMDGFIFATLLLLPFTYPGDIVFTLWGHTASHQGIDQAIMIGLKANAVIFMVMALLGSLGSTDLGRGMMGLYMSTKLTTLLMFTVRYIDVLHQEYLRLRQAMRARAFHLRSNRHSWKMMGYLVGMLLVRAHDRSERIVWAMKCRGFHGHFHFTRLSRPAPSDYIFLLFMALLLAALITLEVLCPPLI